MHGLYTTLLSLAIYPVLGSSATASLGSGPFVALMVNVAANRALHTIHLNAEQALDHLHAADVQNTSKYLDASFAELPYGDVVATITLLTGFFQLAAAALGAKLDLLNSLVADEVLGGFAAGTVVHIGVAQLARFMGIRPTGSKLEIGYVFEVRHALS